MMGKSKDNAYAVVVVGGGAAGMAAAICAARGARRASKSGEGGNESGGAFGVLCIERNGEPGRKLSATGNGRCNFTNAACRESEEVLRFFRELGLLARREADGRIYPYAGQAAVVRDALREEMARCGVVLRCNAPVKALRRTDDGAPEVSGSSRVSRRSLFELETETGAPVRAEKLIIATGGKAGPQYGSVGDGYAFARRLGHAIVSPMPSLVRLVCAEAEKGRLRALAGVRVKCAVALWIGRALAGRSEGELLFAEDGLSGICVMDLSRLMRVKDGGDCRIVLDLAPALEESALAELFEEKRVAFLTGVLPQKLAALVETETGGDARAAARAIKGMAFAVTGTKGWREAQVTSGGVSLDEVDADTMESKLVRGLFFAGEVLDYDGLCGGFNLNWAFRTGMKAGFAASGAMSDA
ncbi:MAG: aminoacetone oxidase family FAD-binding enzyme [Clostridiales Family XIII bacterium]|jgi:predicted Rossmann fold flavoprotein|nr:aminoacetone oxidase family FAD-binding enzyme [Clostridiales Family XIII bacterium]